MKPYIVTHWLASLNNIRHEISHDYFDSYCREFKEIQFNQHTFREKNF